MSNRKSTVSDSMGTVEIPAGALYGAQTQRALDNFRISALRLPVELIRALALLKKAAARCNVESGGLDPDRGTAIEIAADRIVTGEFPDQFAIDVFQTGSGTSTNMNLNEVIATLASDAGLEVNPNDHVNMSQSSNDVFPSAIHVATCIALHGQLLPAVESLVAAVEARVIELQDTIKTGRTHLMDAMPLSMGQELSAWSAQLGDCGSRLRDSLQRLRRLPIGATAVGTGVNSPADFGIRVCAVLKDASGIEFEPLGNLYAGLACQDTALEISGQLRVLATTLTKICNDLRWMNSGPLSGLGEIRLEALQPGSSIMPGKVNPVIPEAVLMVAAQVGGNDATIAIAAQSGNFQLNVMLPVIAYNLLQSVAILASACTHLTGTIAAFVVDGDRLAQNLARNPILATALNPVIGYSAAARIASRAIREMRPILDVAIEMTGIEESRLRQLLDPARLARPHEERSR